MAAALLCARWLEPGIEVFSVVAITMAIQPAPPASSPWTRAGPLLRSRSGHYIATPDQAVRSRRRSSDDSVRSHAATLSVICSGLLAPMIGMVGAGCEVR